MHKVLSAVSRPLVTLALAALFLLDLTMSTPAQMGDAGIRGRAPAALDSGLLDFAGQAVYLYGLRGAPPDQVCTLGDGRAWACGQEARWAARHRIANHWVECVERARVVIAACGRLDGRGRRAGAEQLAGGTGLGAGGARLRR